MIRPAKPASLSGLGGQNGVRNVGGGRQGERRGELMQRGGEKRNCREGGGRTEARESRGIQSSAMTTEVT